MDKKIGRLAAVSEQIFTITRLNLSAKEERANTVHSNPIRLYSAKPARDILYTIKCPADNESFMQKDYANLNETMLRLNNTI